MHKVIGWFTVILGFIASSSGLFTYQKVYNSGDAHLGLGIFNLIFFLLFTAAVEIIFRYWLKKSTRELKLKAEMPIMTIDEFKSYVFDHKKQLWIVDNCVLDNCLFPPIGHYDHFHPGGRFTLTKNFGRDISKFLYGGYKLVNTQQEELRNHSASAIMIASSMIIANL